MKVKICGITNRRDAEAAVKAGADALGFIFARSPRRVSVRTVCSIVRGLSARVTKVGVFVNTPPGKILKTVKACGLDAVQLHGEEAPSVCRRLRPFKLIKTFRVGEDFSVQATRLYPVDAYLLETHGRAWGGTGRSWDWRRLAGRRFRKPVMVTGGLNVSNVRRAIRILKPYGVDVSSGIEARLGKKNHRLMRKFIRYAKK